jgi:hypothetical protein
MIAERREGESLTDYVIRANGECCGCGWVIEIIGELRAMEERDAKRSVAERREDTLARASSVAVSPPKPPGSG